MRKRQPKTKLGAKLTAHIKKCSHEIEVLDFMFAGVLYEKQAWLCSAGCTIGQTESLTDDLQMKTDFIS